MHVSSFSGWPRSAAALIVAAVLAVGAGAPAANADDVPAPVCQVADVASPIVPAAATPPSFESESDAECQKAPVPADYSAHMGGM